MSETFLFGIANGIIAKLGSIAVREVGLAWGVKRELMKLEGSLTAIRAVLLDAEEKKAKNNELKDWMEKLKDACYAIDDVIDEFKFVASRHRSSTTRKVRCFFSSSNPLVFRHRMGRKIKKINEGLDKIEADRVKFGLRERFGDNPAMVAPGETRETYSYLAEHQVLGRDGDKRNILRLLAEELDEHNRVQVLPIVGMGGLGKTTLAKMVYNHESSLPAEASFQVKKWVSVGQDFNVKDVIARILGEEYGASNMEQLQISLRQYLGGKKFLIVLDDVWNQDMAKWAELIGLLGTGGEGSRIVVTTRNRSVGEMVATCGPYYLQELGDEDSLSLFVGWAFKKQDRMQRNYPDLLRIGEEIVKKCRGIPLAIRTLGALLYNKRDLDGRLSVGEWLFIKDHDKWRCDNAGDILPVLKLSYDELPSHLKQCFAQFSAYPKGGILLSNTLINTWIALGFIQSNDPTEELEKLGEKYIRELYSRSFLEDVVDWGYQMTFSMHDLMHDLALFIAEGEHATVNFHVKHVSPRTRYLTFHVNEPFPEKEMPTCLFKLKHTRLVTYFFSGEAYPPSRSHVDMCILRFKCLRVLDLRHLPFDALPSSIGDMKHLRLLDLSHSRNLKSLPNSTCKLRCLQTLSLVSCTELKRLPRDFRSLVCLRTLYLTMQERCLPKKPFESMVSLQRLHIVMCRNLECLFDDDGEVGEASDPISIRTLLIVFCEKLTSIRRSLSCLPGLENLGLFGCEKIDLAEDIEDIHQSGADGGHKRLRYLAIVGIRDLEVLPQWLIRNAASTLTHVSIGRCGITALPGNLESLQKLWIINCPRLTTMPEGINCRGSLKEVVIEACPELIRRCQRDTGDDWNKISSVPEIYLNNISIQDSDNVNNPSGEKKLFRSVSFRKAMKSSMDHVVAGL